MIAGVVKIRTGLLLALGEEPLGNAIGSIPLLGDLRANPKIILRAGDRSAAVFSIMDVRRDKPS